MEGKNGRLVPNKELVLRSKLRIEARQWQMARLQPQQWGDRQRIDIKDDWALLTPEERRRKADELIAMTRELKQPPMQPPPLIYRPEEPDADGNSTSSNKGRHRIETCPFAMSVGFA